MGKKKMSILVCIMLIISMIPANNAKSPVLAASSDEIILYDLDADTSLKPGEAFSSSTLSRSGGVELSVVEDPDGTTSLKLENRVNNWDAVDIVRDALKVNDIFRAGTYTFTVKGRVADGTATDESLFLMGMTESPWSELTSRVKPSADGSFELTYKADHTAAEMSALGYNYRIQTPSGDGTNFFIDSIVVSLKPDDSAGGSAGGSAASGKEVTLYDLDADTGLKAGSFNSPALLRSGDLELSVVKGLDGTTSLKLDNRVNNWDGVDIVRDVLKIDDTFRAGTYTFTIKGRVADGTVLDSSSIIIGMTESPWGELSSRVKPSADGSFELTYKKEYSIADLSKLGYSYRIQTPPGDATNFFIDSIVITMIGSGTVGESEVTELLSFTFDDKAVQEDLFTVAASSKIEWAKGAGIGKDSDTALKISHIADKSYTSADNAVRLTLDEPLPAGGVYKVSAWFYAPAKENEGKGELTGPGIVLNGADGYGGATGITKFPSNVGTLPVGEWKELTVTLPLADAPLSAIDFRLVVNDAEKHADVWYLDSIEISQIGELIAVTIPEWDLTLDSIAEAYKDYFLIGNILEPYQLEDAETIEMFKHHYNAVTAENAMKPTSLSRQKGVYNFEEADKIVSWANDNGFPIHGHTLVWHAQSAPWLTTGEDGKALTRAEAKANLEEYITTVAGHFAGKITSWDVVNEALLAWFSNTSDWKDVLRAFDGGSEASMWYQAYENGADKSKGESGADYIYDAFVLARQADPAAVLYYNDFNETYAAKCEAISMMVEELNAKWKKDSRNTQPERLLIEGIGMQAHYWTDEIKASDIEACIKRFIKTGCELTVLELDLPHESQKTYKQRNEQTEEEERLQADLYRQIFEVYKKYANSIERVTFWGREDVHSWRSEGAPLLFDKVYAAKEAYWAVMEVAENDSIVPVAKETKQEKAEASEYEIYVVQKGDFLWKIAKKLLGKGSDWTKLYEWNKDIIKNPDKIQIGQKLKVVK